MSFFKLLIEEAFVQRAFIAGLILGILAPLIGSLVVVRRLSFIADTLSHFSLAGISIGLFALSKISFLSNYKFIPTYIGIAFAIIGGFCIEGLRSYYKNYKEISMPIVMSLGTALSAVFISLSGGLTTKIYNYLFGSLLTVTERYLYVIAGVLVIVLILFFIFKKTIITISFDEKYAKLLNLNVRLFQILFTLVLSIVVSLSIEVVGVLLVSSLMIIPVASSMKLSWSFASTVIIAIIFSEISIIIGFILSVSLNVSSGGAIVLILILILLISILYKKIKTNKQKKKSKDTPVVQQ